jgi:hypothetical protein
VIDTRNGLPSAHADLQIMCSQFLAKNLTNFFYKITQQRGQL